MTVAVCWQTLNLCSETHTDTHKQTHINTQTHTFLSLCELSLMFTFLQSQKPGLTWIVFHKQTWKDLYRPHTHTHTLGWFDAIMKHSWNEFLLYNGDTRWKNLTSEETEHSLLPSINLPSVCLSVQHPHTHLHLLLFDCSSVSPAAEQLQSEWALIEHRLMGFVSSL